MNIVNTPCYYVMLNSVIGMGRSGGVYRGKRKMGLEGHDPPLPVEVAVKRIYQYLDDPFVMSEIKNEVEILSTLSHPSIVKCCFVHEDANFFYVCTELLPGGTLLDKIIKQQYFCEAEARNICLEVLAIFEYLHDEKNIVHRDLKPDNLLLCATNQNEIGHGMNSYKMKLIDFGFADFISNSPNNQQFQSTNQMNIHSDGDAVNVNVDVDVDPDYCGLSGVLGTEQYMAPEIWKGFRYGKPVDMWALGVMTYQLLCGEMPFYGNTRQEYVEAVIADDADISFYDPSEGGINCWGNVSHHAKDFICRLLNRNPRSRLTVQQAKKHPWVISPLQSLYLFQVY